MPVVQTVMFTGVDCVARVAAIATIVGIDGWVGLC